MIASAHLPTSPSDRTDHRERAFFWIMSAVVLVIFLLPGFLLAPPFVDQGIYAVVAQAMLDRHELPYVAGWDVKGPLTFFLTSGIFALLGTKIWALRCLDLLFLAVAGWGLARIDRDRAVGASVFALFLLLIGLNIVVTTQPDFWATLLCFAMLAVLRSTRPWSALTAGLLLGLAIQLKESYAVFGLCGLVAYGWPFNLKALLRFGAGAALPLLVITGIYAAQGALGTLLYDHWLYLFETHLNTETFMERRFFLIFPDFPDSPRNIARFCFVIGLDALFLAALPGYLAWRQRDRRFANILLAFYVMAVAVLLLQHRFQTPHYTPVIAASVLLTSALVLDQWRLWTTRVLMAIILLRAPMLLLSAGSAYSEAWQFAFGKMEAATYYDLYSDRSSGNPYCVSCLYDAAATIKAQTRPDQSLLIWGYDVSMAVLAERRVMNRLTHVYPLVATQGERQKRYRAELMQALAQKPPAMVVIQTDDIAMLSMTKRESSLELLPSFPELQGWIASNCKFLRQNSSYDLYVCGQNAAP